MSSELLPVPPALGEGRAHSLWRLNKLKDFSAFILVQESWWPWLIIWFPDTELQVNLKWIYLHEKEERKTKRRKEKALLTLHRSQGTLTFCKTGTKSRSGDQSTEMLYLYWLLTFLLIVLETCLQLAHYHHASIQVCILHSCIFFSFLSEWKLKGSFSAVNIIVWLFFYGCFCLVCEQKTIKFLKGILCTFLRIWAFFPHEVWASCLLKPVSKLHITILFCTVLRAEVCKSLWYANNSQKRLANVFHVKYAPYLYGRKKNKENLDINCFASTFFI